VPRSPARSSAPLRRPASTVRARGTTGGRAYEQDEAEGDVNQVDCECGFRARDDDEDRVVELVLEHVSSSHPELAETVTPLVIRRWIEHVP
jgi:hypothetical protein